MLPREWLHGQKKMLFLSGLEDAPIRWLVDDCVKFVEREIRRGNHYDAIIMDPPSYGRGPKGEIWKIEDRHSSTGKALYKILSDDPLFFLINSYTTGLAPAVLTYMISTELKNTEDMWIHKRSDFQYLQMGGTSLWSQWTMGEIRLRIFG